MSGFWTFFFFVLLIWGIASALGIFFYYEPSLGEQLDQAGKLKAECEALKARLKNAEDYRASRVSDLETRERRLQTENCELKAQLGDLKAKQDKQKHALLPLSELLGLSKKEGNA